MAGVEAIFRVLVELGGYPCFLFVSLRQAATLRFQLGPHEFVRVLYLVLEVRGHLILVRSVVS